MGEKGQKKPSKFIKAIPLAEVFLASLMHL